MKRLLNTLYVTTQGAHLSRDGETVAVGVDGETRLRLPIHTLTGIVCFGRVSYTTPLIELCVSRKVAVSFLSEHGRFLARVQGPISGNVLLRREQYRRADNSMESAAIARSIAVGKIANCRSVLLRGAREHASEAGRDALSQAADRLAEHLRKLESPQSLPTVRGLEGEAARTYYGAFDHLILKQKEAFFFCERSRRPPLDNMNALLSFLYTLVAHDVTSALEVVGLDPAVGFLHRDRPGRPSLALDLMEEFRTVLADRVALSLVNLQQVRADGMRTTETGAVVMTDATRRTVLTAFQERKREEVRHRFLAERMAFGLLPHAQALLLARFLRGDLDAYPPYLWK